MPVSKCQALGIPPLKAILFLLAVELDNLPTLLDDLLLVDWDAEELILKISELIPSCRQLPYSETFIDMLQELYDKESTDLWRDEDLSCIIFFYFI